MIHGVTCVTSSREGPTGTEGEPIANDREDTKLMNPQHQRHT